MRPIDAAAVLHAADGGGCCSWRRRERRGKDELERVEEHARAEDSNDGLRAGGGTHMWLMLLLSLSVYALYR